MKKPILILTAGVVVIALLLLVDEKWIKKDNALKTAKKSQETESVQQSSQMAQTKTAAKPTSKPTVYDSSKKAHWYDPETTIGGLYGSSKLLSEWLEPFKPTPEEFQFIAQYETEFKKRKESLTEDEYYSVQGRQWLIKETEKLNEQLLEQIGEDRFLFLSEVRDPATGYHHTWKALTVNGVGEDRVSEFRELADEFNQQMHGIPLFRAERQVAYYSPPGFDISMDEKDRIAKHFRERIEKEFGKQVLDDILSLRGLSVFMKDLTMGMNPDRQVALLLDPKQKERMEKFYDVKFVSEEKGVKDIEESRRRRQRETNLWIEAVKQQAGADAVTGDAP